MRSAAEDSHRKGAVADDHHDGREYSSNFLFPRNHKRRKYGTPVVNEHELRYLLRAEIAGDITSERLTRPPRTEKLG